MSKNLKEHILVVDDDQEIRDMLKTFLEISNYKVTCCENAVEAQNRIREEVFSTFIIDIFLPDMDGIDFIESLQKDGITTPVIVITGSSELELARKAIRLDVYDYLIKPFKQKNLQQVVQNAVMKNHLIEEKQNLEAQRLVYQNELEKLVETKVAELKESESKYRGLMDQSIAGIFIQQDGVFRFANKQTSLIFESSCEDLLDHKSLNDFTSDDDQQKIAKHISELLGEKYVKKGLTFVIQTGAGNKKTVEMWADEVTFQGRQAIEGMIIDITDQQEFHERERMLELHLLQEHKLAAIGRLTAGISHNLNTPISIIQGNAELLKLNHSELKETDIILRQTHRMADIIRTIARKGNVEQNSEPVEIDFNKLLGDELSFLEANLFFKHHIKKNLDFAEYLPPVQGLYSDFSQSLLQIIQNAVDAMYEAEKRELTIRTKVVEDQIVVDIQDSGPGIPDDVQKEMFNPFFTTKPVHEKNAAKPDAPRGTGLGLSFAKNSMAPYGATIEYETIPGMGTTFSVKIPISDIKG